MQVWVVEHGFDGFDYKGSDIDAVFSSKEAAESWVAALVNEDEDFGRHGEYYKLWSFVVDGMVKK